MSVHHSLPHVTAGNRRPLSHLDAMPVQEAGEPVRIIENLAIDPGVAPMLHQLGGCGLPAEEQAEALVLQRAYAHVQPGRPSIVTAGRRRWRIRPACAGLNGGTADAGSVDPVQLL